MTGNNGKETRGVKATFFKPAGKYYAEETVQVPADLKEMFQVVEWLETNCKSYKGMHMVLMMDEYENGYPCMIPADRR